VILKSLATVLTSIADGKSLNALAAHTLHWLEEAVPMAPGFPAMDRGFAAEVGASRHWLPEREGKNYYPENWKNCLPRTRAN